MSLLEIDQLQVSFAQQGGSIAAVRGVSFRLEDGESLGIVGESGSGKSVTCMALLRLLAPTAQISAKTLRLAGVDVLKAPKRDLSQLRGRVAALIFQDPMTAFDPVFTIGHQIVETIRTHRSVGKKAALEEARHWLERVEIKNAADVLNYYPHQLSGGMLQRAMIAMALSCRPRLLIADEPTTALDVTIQAQILQLIKSLQAELGMALIMITHDLGVVAETVDRVIVMYQGQVREEGPVEAIFDHPRDSYTQALLASLRAGETRETSRRVDDGSQPALELRGLKKSYFVRRRGRFTSTLVEVPAVQHVDLRLPRNRIIGVVGESGSGKSTTGMMAMRLLEPTAGEIRVEGEDIARLDPRGLKAFRRRMQVVFQDSYSALDPMLTLTEIVAEPLHIHGIGSPRQQAEEALGWLDRVGLDRSFGGRYPHELSGGQRQRVAIARALILKPAVLVADEPTSALDVTVKAQIIALLEQLQQDMGLSLMFISHDLSVVRSFTDSVVVMYKGRVVEQAPTAAIFSDARHPYTRALLDAIPATDPRRRRQRTFLSPDDIAAAIPRLSQSDIAAPVPASATPQLVAVGPEHFVEAVVSA